MNLANPEYESLIDDASMRDVISRGEKGTLMPAFAQENGGQLTDKQIDALLEGIRGSWRKEKVLAGKRLHLTKQPVPGMWQKGRLSTRLHARGVMGCRRRSQGRVGRSWMDRSLR